MGSRALARSSGWIAMLLRGWTQLQRHTATLCLSLQHPGSRHVGPCLAAGMWGQKTAGVYQYPIWDRWHSERRQ